MRCKNVNNYYGLYAISDTGSLFNLTNGKKLKGIVTKYGYRVYTLTKNGEHKNYFAHRLVADAFIRKPFDKNFVNHKDGNKLNNNVSNLEWVTPSENELHSYGVLGKVCYCKGLKGKNHPASKPLKAINIDTGEQLIFESRLEASSELNIDGSGITRAAQGKRSRAGRWIFEYIGNDTSHLR